MNRYLLTQIFTASAVVLALSWWLYAPGNDLAAGHYIEIMLRVLQIAIIPNAFLSLLTAVLSIKLDSLKSMFRCFVKTIGQLWGLVILVLFGVWVLYHSQNGQASVLPTFTPSKAGVTVLLPAVMVCSLFIGFAILRFPRLSFLTPWIINAQRKVALLFDYVFLLIPVLAFFVVLNFVNHVGFDHSVMVLHYFMLALTFVCIINFIVFPVLYNRVLEVKFSHYLSVISPVVLMTFVAGDSIAAIPLIAVSADQFGATKAPDAARMLTLVIICFPWVGELANLVFPIYSAVLEGFSYIGVLKILSVGPFFMFTDPYISIPVLLDSFGFPEYYRSTYMTMAILTDHMFEVSEAIAVLFVVSRLKLTLYPHNASKPSHLEV